VSATFGAGLSHACVLDVGAQTTTIACVDEGAIIPDSRINLKYGGDDITDFFTRLLLRSAHPWPDLDLHKSVDFRVLQYAKERSCTLFENEVAMQLGESEFSETDHFLPILLHRATLHPALHNAAFVRYYRGPYWGIIELQAKWCAGLFSGRLPWPSVNEMKEGIR